MATKVAMLLAAVRGTDEMNRAMHDAIRDAEVAMRGVNQITLGSAVASMTTKE